MSKTKVSTENGKFMINGDYVYKGCSWKGVSMEGLLMNARLVQATFDDVNPKTVHRFAYPDTGVWDADRHTSEFVEMMPLYHEKGLAAFTINMQGGNPGGFSNWYQKYWNIGFNRDGALDPKYMARLKKVLDKADELGMAVILGYFYFGQDKYFEDEEDVVNAARNMTHWIVEQDYTNVIIEVCNESNTPYYRHPILRPERVHELIKMVREWSGSKLLVSTSFGGGFIPVDNVLEVEDFILVHGNGQDDPKIIGEMVREIQAKSSYRGQPIVFNEDDHFDFDKDINNMTEAVRNGAGWGYFDWAGFQKVPVNWAIDTDRKKGFFTLLEEMTGSAL